MLALLVAWLVIAGLCVGRVRDGSVKPAVCEGFCNGKSEDLERTARAAGNAHVIKLIEKTRLIISNLQL